MREDTKNKIVHEAFLSELSKIASVPPLPGNPSRFTKLLHHTSHLEDPIEVAGLAALAAPAIDNLQARHRARKAGLADADGHVSEHDMDKFRGMSEGAHEAIDVGGLGVLAAPSLSKMILNRKGIKGH